jgi:hypothetical protein
LAVTRVAGISRVPRPAAGMITVRKDVVMCRFPFILADCRSIRPVH